MTRYESVLRTFLSPNERVDLKNHFASDGRYHARELSPVSPKTWVPTICSIMAAGPRQISQPTFDAIVREAMSDFGMTADDAVVEARSQLELAGVTDFSNLITSMPPSKSQDHPAVELLARLRLALQSRSGDTFELRDALDALANHAGSNPEIRGVAGARGALSDLLEAMRTEPAHAVAALAALCEGSETNRSSFLAIPDAFQSLQQAFLSLCNTEHATEKLSSASTVSDCGSDFSRLSALKAMAVILDKCERCKHDFSCNTACISVVFELLSKRSNVSVDVQRSCIAILRSLLSADDVTTDVCDTFNRAKRYCCAGSSGAGVLSEPPLKAEMFAPLPNLLRDIVVENIPEEAGSETSEPYVVVKPCSVAVIVDCFMLARMCAVSNEVCEIFLDLGFHNLVVQLLSPTSGLHTCSADLRSECPVNPILARAGISFLRNLAACDRAKTLLSEHMSAICAVVTGHKSDALLADRFCAFVGVECLRRPDIATKLTAEHDIVDSVLTAMETHAELESLQKSACYALRALISRNDERKRLLREEGRAERIIRRAQEKFPSQCKDIAYFVLFDLDVLADSEIRRDRRYTTPF